VRVKYPGSSLLATLGFVAESLWDSSVPAGSKDACKVRKTATALPESKKGGSTQSRLNLTNHHYKEPKASVAKPRRVDMG
jgi:hypothetical protein